MAGRKHHLQQFGYAGKDLSQITDPIERDFAFKSISLTPYCMHCGKEILMLAKQEGSAQKFQAEIKAKAHTQCRNQWEEEMRTQAAIEARKKAEEEANFDIDDYVAQMMKQREEDNGTES